MVNDMNENNNEVSVNESQVSTTPIEENVQKTSYYFFLHMQGNLE